MRMVYIYTTRQPKNYSTEPCVHSVTGVSALKSRLTLQSMSCAGPLSGHVMPFLPLSSGKKRKPSGYRNRFLSISSIGPHGSTGEERCNFAMTSTAMTNCLARVCPLKSQHPPSRTSNPKVSPWFNHKRRRRVGSNLSLRLPPRHSQLCRKVDLCCCLSSLRQNRRSQVMGKKGHYTRELSMPFLLVVPCFLQYLLARPVLSASLEKGKASTVAQMPRNPSQKTTSAHVITKPIKKSAAKARRKNVARGSASRTVVHTSTKSATFTSAKKNKGNIVAKAKQKSSGKTAQPDVLLEPAEPFSQEYNQAAVLEASSSFSPETAPFPAQLNDERLAYQINSAFVLPAEKFILTVGEGEGKNAYLFQSALEATQIGPSTWSWQAPRKAGLYPVIILHPPWGATMVLNVFVMVPFFQLDEGYLNGYRVGNYPR